jgi:hypothetical protein
MKASLAFTLAVAVFFFQSIPLLVQARPLRLDTADDRRLSLLPRTSIAKYPGEAPAVDGVEPGRRSVDGGEEVAPGNTDNTLHRTGELSPPSPQGSNPPHYRQPAVRWGSNPWVGGSRPPFRPPAPSGQKPPHWRGSEDRSSSRLVDVFRLLRMLSNMFC